MYLPNNAAQRWRAHRPARAERWITAHAPPARCAASEIVCAAGSVGAPLRKYFRYRPEPDAARREERAAANRNPFRIAARRPAPRRPAAELPETDGSWS